MTSVPRFFLLTVLLGVIGYAVAALTFFRVDPSTNWHYELSRPAALEHARLTVREIDPQLDVSNWSAYVTTIRDGATDYFRFQNQGKWSDVPALSPVLTTVRFVEQSGPANGKRNVTVDLAADGHPLGYKFFTSAEDKNNGEQNQTPPPGPEARSLAEQGLRQLSGNAFANFQLVSQTDEGKDEGRRFNWEQKVEGTTDVKLKATALVNHQVIRELKINADFAPSFLNAYHTRVISIWRDPLTILLAIGVGLFTLILFVVGLSRRQLLFSSSLILFAVLFGLTVVARLAGGVSDAVRVNLSNETTSLTALGAALAALLLPSFFYALSFALVWMIGLWLARRSTPERHLTLLNLIKGKLNRRKVGNSLTTGFLLGGAVAAIPLIVAASGFFPGYTSTRRDSDLFVAPFPLISALLTGLPLNLFALYGMLVPFGAAYFGRGRKFLSWRFAFILPVSFIWMIDVAVTGHAPWAIVLVALGLVLFADWIFWRTDLLTLLVAFMSADVLLNALTLVHQSSRTLTGAGWLTLGSLAGLTIISFFLQKAGSESALTNDAEALVMEHEQVEARVEREKLVAEFGVARSAQERMLPKTSPSIPGYQIAAHCTPAREVGGDLFDFVQLPDERMGVVVADVSGKGVPAALYMTLTKGLIASVAQSESDPHRILCEVNRHLYEVCRRKVFVTMMFGVLDPATGEFTYARAGHNPAVWRRPQSEQTEWLKPNGIGLGLDRGTIFERSLKAATIHIKPDEALVFYSDGLTEAMNAAREEYGEARLQKIVEQADGLSAEHTLRVILEDVEYFLQGVHQQDDLTLIVIRAT